MLIKNYTIDYIRSLYADYKSGDWSVIDELRDINAILSKRANTRLSSLEEKGYDYYAYDTAVHYTQQKYGKRRFTTSKKILSDVDELYDNILEVNRFLRSESSTISGQKRIEKERIASFRDMGLEINVGEERDFLRFLGTEDVRGVFEIVGNKKRGGMSGEIVDIIAGQWKGELNKKRIRDAFTAYKQGTIFYDEFLERLRK